MSKDTLWVVTTEYNEYDQYGEYFVAAFKDKPTKEELEKLVDNADHVLAGGGRIEHEHQWFWLREVRNGAEYGHVHV